ncbi:MAG TPA: hypothetical protein VK393_01790 [Nocardioidaceae bacterium]|jgi:hypothetical protein|nr:hypothetical protein [Nocardioidaceae bacterium]
MPTYLVERFLPTPEDLRSVSDQTQHAVDALAAAGLDVRYCGLTFIPRDEVCFQWFEAPSAEVAARASREAGIRYDRISEAVQVPAPQARR